MFRLFVLACGVIWLATAVAFGGTIAVDGVARTYILDRPPGQSRPAPLIVALHGSGGWGLQLRGYSKLSEAANPQGIAVVYPDGIDGNWNDGRVTPSGQLVHDEDDILFLSRLVAELVRLRVADPRRIVFTGMSNGAMMSIRMACDSRMTISGIMPVAGNIPVPLNCRLARMRFLHIEGTADPRMPFNGGYVSGLPRLGSVVSAPQTFATFLIANGCAGRVKVALPNPVSDGTRSTIESGRGCTADTSQIVVVGGGHTWPGADPKVFRDAGPTAQDFSASAMAVRLTLGQPLN